MSGTSVANYFATLSFKTDLRSVRQLDQSLNQASKRIDAFSKLSSKKLTAAFAKFQLPALTVKTVNLDTLKLQKSLQVDLNKVSKLLTLDVNNFIIDQGKLNRQVQTSMQRAANQARIVTKTVTGNSGGYGVHHVGGSTNSIGGVGGITPRQSRQFSNYGAAGAAGAVIGGLGSMFAPSAVAYGAWAGGRQLYNANSEAVSNRHLIANVVADPNGTADSNKKAGVAAYDYLYKESNRLGMDAKSQVEGYGSVLAAGQSSGLDLKQSQKLYTQMSEHATVMHLTTEKQKRLLAAVGQSLSKGQLYSEEVKGQMAESSPTLPGFIAKAWAEQTKSNLKGAAATSALYKAMEKGLVKSDTLLRAMELASLSAQPGLKLSTNTSAAEANRTKNTISYSMNDASVAGVEDGFWRMNRAISVFTKDLAPHGEAAAVSFAQYLGAMADFTLGLRGLAKNIPGSRQETVEAAKKLPHSYLTRVLAGGPASLAVDLGKLSYNLTTDYMKGSQHATKGGADRMAKLSNLYKGITPLPSPMSMSPTSNAGYIPKTSKADPYGLNDTYALVHNPVQGRDSAFQSAYDQVRQNTVNNSTVTVEVGGITVQANGMSGPEVEESMAATAKRVFTGVMGEVMQNFGQKE